MKAIDMHSHYSTKRGFLFQTLEEIALQEKTFKFKAVYRTEDEMAEDFRNAGLKTVLDFGFTLRPSVTFDRIRQLHDYAAEVIGKHSDVFIGGWVSISPVHGEKGVRELERCLRDLHFIGLLMNPAMINIAPGDPRYFPYYEACIRKKAPVLMAVGYTVEGAGLPGGSGNILEYNHPRHVDEVAAKFPALTIVAGRQAWPWVNEMTAVLLHKPNVWHELHGWSPKYFSPELKWEIGHRLQDKVMFGADYPLLGPERLFHDWESEGYSPEILEKVYFKNAQRFFRQLGREIS